MYSNSGSFNTTEGADPTIAAIFRLVTLPRR